MSQRERDRDREELRVLSKERGLRVTTSLGGKSQRGQMETRRRRSRRRTL